MELRFCLCVRFSYAIKLVVCVDSLIWCQVGFWVGFGLVLLLACFALPGCLGLDVFVFSIC